MRGTSHHFFGVDVAMEFQCFDDSCEAVENNERLVDLKSGGFAFKALDGGSKAQVV